MGEMCNTEHTHKQQTKCDHVLTGVQGIERCATKDVCVCWSFTLIWDGARERMQWRNAMMCLTRM